MGESDAPDATRTRRRAQPFRPSFTLLILYLAFFFMVFGLLAVLPDLVRVLESAGAVPAGALAPDPEALQAHATEVTRASMRGKVGYVLVLAVVATGTLGYFGRLPGIRSS